MKKSILLFLLFIFSSFSYSYDYLKHTGVVTKAESCKMYREFDLEDCKKQAATVKGHFYQPKCDMWNRQRESALADCNGVSDRAIMEKEQNKDRQSLRRDHTHILFEKGRLVCRSEKSFRDTYNYVVTQQPGTPPHLRSKICRVLQYETIVKIDNKSSDQKVAEITYMDNYGALRYGFTALAWLVTKEKYKEIVEQRKNGLM